MRNYGGPIKNHAAVFRGEATGALLCIIYLDDMPQDYQSLNDKAGLPRRLGILPTQENHYRKTPRNPQKQRGAQNRYRELRKNTTKGTLHTQHETPPRNTPSRIPPTDQSIAPPGNANTRTLLHENGKDRTLNQISELGHDKKQKRR